MTLGKTWNVCIFVNERLMGGRGQQNLRQAVHVLDYLENDWQRQFQLGLSHEKSSENHRAKWKMSKGLSLQHTTLFMLHRQTFVVPKALPGIAFADSGIAMDT